MMKLTLGICYELDDMIHSFYYSKNSAMVKKLLFLFLNWVNCGLNLVAV